MSPVLGGAIGAGLNLLGGIAGEIWAGADEEERKRLEQMAMDQYGDISAPALEAIIAQETKGSAMEGAPNDFGNKGVRNAAIQRLMEEGLSGGNTLETQMAQANAQRAAGQASRSASQSALQSAAGRGMGGASSTLQAQLLGASTGADRAAQVGLQGASDARRNALTALQQGGGMAGQAEEADGARDMARRQSLDRIAMFNAEQRGAADRFNTQLGQQRFDNDMQVRDKKAGAYRRQADNKAQEAERKRRMAGGLGQSAGSAATAWGQYGGKP